MNYVLPTPITHCSGYDINDDVTLTSQISFGIEKMPKRPIYGHFWCVFATDNLGRICRPKWFFVETFILPSYNFLSQNIFGQEVQPLFSGSKTIRKMQDIWHFYENANFSYSFWSSIAVMMMLWLTKMICCSNINII